MPERRLSRNAVFRETVPDVLPDGGQLYRRGIRPVVEAGAAPPCQGFCR